MKIGYTAGVFDLFHSGHVRLLKNSRSLVDKLIVGVTVDKLVNYKGKNALIPFEQRLEVVSSCRYVDVAIPQYSIDKVDMCIKLKANFLFVGDDWFETDTWKQMESELALHGIKVVYFPYTRNISSTKINKIIDETP